MATDLWNLLMIFKPILIAIFAFGIGCGLISLYWQWDEYCWKKGKGKYKW